MKQKRKGSTGEQSLDFSNRGLSLSDKYVCLQQENQKLKRQLRKIGEAFNYWRELSLYYQAKRDYYQEQTQEGIRDL